MQSVCLSPSNGYLVRVGLVLLMWREDLETEINVTPTDVHKFWFLLPRLFSFQFYFPDLGTLETAPFLPKRLNENVKL